MRKDGAQPHCFVMICEKIDVAARTNPDAAHHSVTGGGGWGEEGLGAAMGSLEGVMSAMLSDDSDVSMLTGLLGMFACIFACLFCVCA